MGHRAAQHYTPPGWVLAFCPLPGRRAQYKNCAEEVARGQDRMIERIGKSKAEKAHWVSPAKE